MSLKTRFKNLGNILAQDETQTDVYVLESPVLTTGHVRAHPRLSSARTTWPCSTPPWRLAAVPARRPAPPLRACARPAAG